jgi:pyruvate,water dikinase
MASPVTPSMESWLLPALAKGASDFRRFAVGLTMPEPAFVVVNGWYFSSINYLPRSPGSVLAMFAALALHAALHPRRASLIFVGPLSGPAEEVYVSHWRSTHRRYHEAIHRAETELNGLDPPLSIPLIDRVARAAAEYYGSVSGVIGLAWKAELLLAEFCRDHLQGAIEGHQDLLLGLRPEPLSPAGHAAIDLDWSRPTRGELANASSSTTQLARIAQELNDRRASAEERARRKLSSSKRERESFERLLADAQRLAPLRQESSVDLTLGWPVMRKALLALGRAILSPSASDSVFFLTRAEIVEAVAGGLPSRAELVSQRQKAHAEQEKLAPPLSVGELPQAFLRAQRMSEALRVPGPREDLLLEGAPASPGLAIGPTRLVRDERDFEAFPAGAVLVARATPPAWLQVFERAAAIVTDSGSVLSHSAILAREYGIPAVVGVGSGALRLQDGTLVAVDGARGTVSSARARGQS